MKKPFDLRIFMTSVRLEAGEGVACGPGPRMLKELLQMRGESFLYRAYHVFLARKPDRAALEGYGVLANSLRGRILLLLALTFSPERKSLNPVVFATFKMLGRLLRGKGPVANR